jgi:hypothetical protein
LGHFCHIPILGIRVVPHDDHLADLKLHAFLVLPGAQPIFRGGMRER